MYLKKLDLIGFKSFADPTTVTFQSGITVIVGPNGCGKSNIVDAILWVLGEQSAKTLRSDRMEDVIFNGSETRKPINMSEIILTVGGVRSEDLGNRFGEFEELSLCRRLFRSGESEYLINRIPCRLRDIRDVLIDTGAGHKGHTIIEQGKVDQLLNASPVERRALIEETAGIAKFKIRKAEAERKLASTEQNLFRVRDIISEVKRQISGLDRQVKKTELYNGLKAKAQSLEELLLADEFQQLDREYTELSQKVIGKQAEESDCLRQLSALEAQVQHAKTDLADEERSVTNLRQRTYDQKTQIHRQENRVELLKSQMASWEDQRNRLTLELEGFERMKEISKKEHENMTRQKEEATQTIGSLREQIQVKEKEASDLDNQAAQQSKEHDLKKSQLFEVLGRLTEAKNLAAASDSRYSEIMRNQEKAQAELMAVLRETNQAEATLGTEKISLKGLEEEVERTIISEKALQEELETCQKRVEGEDSRVESAHKALTHMEARLSSLKEHEKALREGQETLREQLRDEHELLQQFSGVVADVLTVNPQYERAIEAVLGDRLQALIVDDHGTVLSAIQRLRDGGMMRGVFLPKTPRVKPSFSNSGSTEGVIGPAIAYVEARPGFEGLVQAMLGGVILVEDLKRAFRLWGEKPISEILVTLDGEIVYPSGMVVAGIPVSGDKGFLETRRKILEMEQEVTRLGLELAEMVEGRSQTIASRDRHTALLQELGEKQHRHELDATVQREKVVSLEGEISRLSQHRLVLQTEENHRNKELQELKQTVTRSREEIRELDDQQERIHAQLSKDQEDLQAFAERRKGLSSQLTQEQMSLTSLIERQDHYEKESSRLIRMQQELDEKIQNHQSEIDGLLTRIRTASRDQEESEKTINELSMSLVEIESTFNETTQLYTDHLNQIRTQEEDLGKIRTQWGRIEQDLKGLELRQTELNMKLEQIRDHLRTSYKKSPEDVWPRLEAEGFDRELAQADLETVRAKVDQVGPVNLAAPEEYKELEERYQFLTTQESDLTSSMEDLQKAIQKINRTTKELFLTAFQSLRSKFSEVFETFFEGGQADLILEDESNPLDSGLEIVAQPPGKKLRHISLLSGGEKALTAISLLFSSFLIHPSPFCVLDEIDAPLDEENTRRFLKALSQMVNLSQFLVITHNKRTMEQADILYGVTMEEAGVSKLVSVKLGSEGNGSSHLEPHLPTVATSTNLS